MKANWSEDLKYNFKVLDPNKITLDKAIEEFGEDTKEYNKCIFALETIDRCFYKHNIKEEDIVEIRVDMENMVVAKTHGFFPINIYINHYQNEELLNDLDELIDVSEFTSFIHPNKNGELKDITIYNKGGRN